MDKMDIQLSRIFGYHGYRTSWIFGHHGYSDIMHIRTSLIFGYHGYTDIMDILGEHND